MSSDHPSTASSPTQVDNDHYYFNSDASELEKSIDNKSLDDRVYAASHEEVSIFSSNPSSIFDPNLDENFEVPEQEDSPYAEVRAAVANVDDPTMPVSTVRVWVLGVLGAMVLPGLNQFFYFRYPTVNVGGLVAQLLVFPLGRFWARFCPNVSILGVSLNPGPFSMKEHVLVTVMASVGASPAYATDIIAVQKKFYGSSFHPIYQWMLAVSTQLIGFSFGGIARRFLVAPPSMIWPNTLVQCALFNTLHSQVYAGIDNEGTSRERYFLYAFLATIVWYFVPGYLFEALSVFSWVCWIAPENVVVNQLFGYRSGLGFSLLTFDWNQIAFIGSPLATPWWAEANVIVGFVFFYWFLTPILYYTNTWYSHYLPMSSSLAYDNRGKPYNVKRIIGPDGTLNKAEYHAYSPLFLSPTFVINYGLSFIAITATITHTFLYFWKPIKLHFRRSFKEQQDVHARLMSKYRQVPEWYYLIVFAVTFVFACLCIELWPTGMTIWALVLALFIALIYVVPIGMIQAVTNRQVGLNVITELIVGYMLPGKPIAMMLFKTYGYVTMSQAMQFTADFKLGHYMKVPPRPMFFAQILASVVAATTQLGVQAWMFANIDGICDEKQKNRFTCEGTNVFGTASIIWGVIGPELQFSKGHLYYGLLFFFVVGAVAPLIPWLITRRYPRSILRYLNFPLLCTALQMIPPATAVNFVPWAIIGFLFQYVLRRRKFVYWAKYNYTLSAALDAGTAVGTLIVYFALQYPLNGKLGKHTIQQWWGNRVHIDTADWNRISLKRMPEGETFGPKTW